ncbi:hypothetical protein FB45DRAFT_760769, partial [Roridomyces roridus]
MWRDDVRLPLPDIVLGDWNFVEDIKDRLSGSSENTPPSFLRLKDLLKIEDGWRQTFSDQREYTCVQHRYNAENDTWHVSRSRLDRIYIQHKLANMCRGWRIEQTAIKTDHSLATVQLVCREDQKPGTGRFRLPLYLLKTPKFMREVRRLGKILDEECKQVTEDLRTPDHNIQILWAKFKRDIIAYAKK